MTKVKSNNTEKENEAISKQNLTKTQRKSWEVLLFLDEFTALFFFSAISEISNSRIFMPNDKKVHFVSRVKELLHEQKQRLF